MVFYELLPNSPTPGADLEALGASGELMKYSGTTAFVENSPINQPWFQEAFFDKVGHRHVLQFYLIHPQRFWRLIKKSAQGAFTLRDCCLGNFEKRTGLPPNSQSAGFGLWSGFRQHALPGSAWTLLIFFSANFAAAVSLYGRHHLSPRARLGIEAYAVLNVMALGAFFISTLGDGLDITRHLFAFHAMMDLCLLINIVWLVEVGSRFISNRKEQFAPVSRQLDFR